MSVNAINAADQQPQRKSSPIVPALVAGTVLGGAGYAGGHYFGGTRPDLDKVFAMTDDQFTKSTKDSLEGATAEQKADLDKIKNARTEYAGAGATEDKTLLDKMLKRGKIVNDDTMKPDNFEELQKAITDKNAKLLNKKVDLSETRKNVGFSDVFDNVENKKNEWVQAKKNLKDASDADKAAKQEIVNKKLEELKQAKADRKAFYNKAKTEVDDAIKANRAMNSARVTKYDAEAGKDGTEAKKLSNEIAQARKDLTEAKNKKLTEIKGRKEITDAFESVKKLFAKEGKGKTAWIAAGIAAAVGLIGGFILGGSKNDVA